MTPEAMRAAYDATRRVQQELGHRLDTERLSDAERRELDRQHKVLSRAVATVWSAMGAMQEGERKLAEVRLEPFEAVEAALDARLASARKKWAAMKHAHTMSRSSAEGTAAFLLRGEIDELEAALRCLRYGTTDDGLSFAQVPESLARELGRAGLLERDLKPLLVMRRRAEELRQRVRLAHIAAQDAIEAVAGLLTEPAEAATTS